MPRAVTGAVPKNETGMLLTGFKSALTRTINVYARRSGWFKKGGVEGLSGDDVDPRRRFIEKHAQYAKLDV